ncbi:MAG: hypothetical protein PF693_05470 [Spirochaetia bacterium]|jgi:hypothetical protein|nr:hypothetical protein [Spirochaetia bacterium]
MVKYIAAAVLVLVPLLWGIIMAPILDYFGKKVPFRSKHGEPLDE